MSKNILPSLRRPLEVFGFFSSWHQIHDIISTLILHLIVLKFNSIQLNSYAKQIRVSIRLHGFKGSVPQDCPHIRCRLQILVTQVTHIYVQFSYKWVPTPSHQVKLLELHREWRKTYYYQFTIKDKTQEQPNGRRCIRQGGGQGSFPALSRAPIVPAQWSIYQSSPTQFRGFDGGFITQAWWNHWLLMINLISSPSSLLGGWGSKAESPTSLIMP